MPTTTLAVGLYDRRMGERRDVTVGGVRLACHVGGLRLLRPWCSCTHSERAARDRLPDITAPTLMIGGGPSSHVPQEKLAEAAARIPTCAMRTIPAGHHVHAAEPQEFTATVLDFLRTAPAVTT